MSTVYNYILLFLAFDSVAYNLLSLVIRNPSHSNTYFLFSLYIEEKRVIIVAKIMTVFPIIALVKLVSQNVINKRVKRRRRRRRRRKKTQPISNPSFLSSWTYIIIIIHSNTSFKIRLFCGSGIDCSTTTTTISDGNCMDGSIATTNSISVIMYVLSASISS